MVLLLDIRTRREYCQAHICGARLVETPLPPLNTIRSKNLRLRLERTLKNVPKYTTIHVYCKKGIRAGLAARILRAMGYQRVRVLGGVAEPKLAGEIRQGKYKMCAC